MAAHRALMWVIATLALALAAVGVAALTAWTRCGGDGECGNELALSIVALPPATLLAGVALLLLRTHERTSWVRRATVAICVALAMAPLTAFLVGDPIILALMSLLFAALVYLAQRDDARDAALGRAGTTVPALRARPLRSLRPEVHAAAYADPEQTLRLNAVRDAARSLDAGAYRLQQTSVRTMTAMMRLRRAIAARHAAPADTLPAWMRRHAEALDLEDEPRVIQLRR